MPPLYETPRSTADKWYNKTGWVIFWTAVFFPVGVVGLFMNQSLSLSAKWGIGIAGLFFMIGIINSGNKKNGIDQPDLKIQTAEQRREDSLNSIYESHRKISKDLRYEGRHFIRTSLKDPDSFNEIEHSETILDKPKPPVHYQSRIKYRAKNSFNGFVVETRCFDFNSIGGIVASYECD